MRVSRSIERRVTRAGPEQEQEKMGLPCGIMEKERERKGGTRRGGKNGQASLGATLKNQRGVATWAGRGLRVETVDACVCNTITRG